MKITILIVKIYCKQKWNHESQCEKQSQGKYNLWMEYFIVW